MSSNSQPAGAWSIDLASGKLFIANSRLASRLNAVLREYVAPDGTPYLFQAGEEAIFHLRSNITRSELQVEYSEVWRQLLDFKEAA